MQNKLITLALILFVGLIILGRGAQAACSSPTGAASQTRYDTTENKMYYCDDTDWVEMGGGGGTPIIDRMSMAGFTISSVTIPATGNKWPDYLICDNASTESAILLQLGRYQEPSQGGDVLYEVGRDALNEYQFNINGSFKSQNGVSANCGASGNDIASICNDGRCGFY